jgi:hypothetical protein
VRPGGVTTEFDCIVTSCDCGGECNSECVRRTIAVLELKNLVNIYKDYPKNAGVESLLNQRHFGPNKTLFTPLARTPIIYMSTKIDLPTSQFVTTSLVQTMSIADAMRCTKMLSL